MKIAPIAEVKAKFSKYLRACEDGQVVVTTNGRPVAVLLSIVDEDELERLILAYSAKFQAILDEGKEQIQQTGGNQHRICGKR